MLELLCCNVYNMHAYVHVHVLLLRYTLCCNVYNMHAYVHAYNIHVLMRDEKEGRKKQARSTTYVY